MHQGSSHAWNGFSRSRFFAQLTYVGNSSKKCSSDCNLSKTKIGKGLSGGSHACGAWGHTYAKWLQEKVTFRIQRPEPRRRTTTTTMISPRRANSAVNQGEFLKINGSTPNLFEDYRRLWQGNVNPAPRSRPHCYAWDQAEHCQLYQACKHRLIPSQILNFYVDADWCIPHQIQRN